MNVALRLMEAAVEFVWWWGLHSHFNVQPNYSFEVLLRCVVVGVVTTLTAEKIGKKPEKCKQ